MQDQLSQVPIDQDIQQIHTSQLIADSPLHGVICISPNFSEEEPLLYHLSSSEPSPPIISLPINVYIIITHT